MLQCQLGTSERAQRFYDQQVLDHLNPAMRDFVRRQRMMFVATADAKGECDSTLRAGPPGFLEILDERTVAWPEYRGNGVMASLGNISENPHVGLLMVDFVEVGVGLHINGRAQLVRHADMQRAGLDGGSSPAARAVEVWVAVQVEEAYIHCSKHIPRLADPVQEDRHPTRGRRRKTVDYFGAARSRHLSDDAEAAS